MRRVRPIRPQRAPIFIGCEGQSEMGYAGWLRNLARDRNVPVHLELSDLGRGAGDPLTRIDMAIERIERIERNRERFVGKYLFLDTDQLADNLFRAEQARRRAQDRGISVIWQEPTHEGFLLRHFANCHTRRPPDKQTADQALSREWANYSKPSTAKDIEGRLAIDGARRVAASLPELEELLRVLNLWNE